MLYSALLLGALVLSPRDGTTTRPPVVRVAPRFAIMDDYIRDFLAKEWDAHARDPIQLERGYCLRYQRDLWAQEPAYRVTQIFPAEVREADTHSIHFDCPHDPNVTDVHIHPDQTCASETDCWAAGPYGGQCLASDSDRRYLAWTKRPFAFVQCDRRAFVAYFATTAPAPTSP